MRGAVDRAGGAAEADRSGDGVSVRFAGYAAVFGKPDRGGDMIRPGAFAESLARGNAVPLLWQHKAGAVIGRVEHLSEDRRGLRVIAELGTGEEARRAASLLASGKLDGLSFGYRVREAGRRGDLRELIDLDLIEVSLVAEPMQPKARVHAVE
ncbi:HK97 family phage prohead protease [Sphingomonas sp.]|uniref:HK97 family phage prohead protease n=1 Tax=Sphingomonas sp. TaxID=28214 RepID=UPI00345BDBD5